MKALLLSATLFVLALPGCSEQARDQGGGALGGGAEQMSYGYTYRFALPGDVVTQTQDRHVAMCDQLGPGRCRMQEMHRSANTGSSDGSTRFAVASGDARKFGQDLIAPVTSVNGTMTSREFEAENVSKQIAEAQAKTVEKDNVANRTMLMEAQGRIATSTIWVYYDGKTAFGEEVGAAFADAGETMRSSIIALIYVLSAVLPWALVFGVIFLIVRAGFRRFRAAFPRAGGSTARYQAPGRPHEPLVAAPLVQPDDRAS